MLIVLLSHYSHYVDLVHFCVLKEMSEIYLIRLSDYLATITKKQIMLSLLFTKYFMHPLFMPYMIRCLVTHTVSNISVGFPIIFLLVSNVSLFRIMNQ